MIFDCISQTPTMDLCSDAMGDNGGTLVTTLQPKPDFVPRPNIRIIPVLSYTAVGKAFVKGDGQPITPAKPEDKEFAG